MSDETIYRVDGGTVYRSAEIAYTEGSDGKPGILEGKMVPYDTWTEIRSAVEGHFFERIKTGALTKTLSERANRMKILFHHGMDLLGKQPIAKLEELRDEADGPYYRARLISGVPELLLNGLREGVYGSSIGMRMPVKADVNYTPKRSEMNPNSIPESTVLEAGIDEISVTAFPVYEGATAGVRSLTDEVVLRSHGDLIVAKLAREDPERLLQLVRTELEVEPPHSEPPAEEAPQEEREPEHSPKPTRDYLSDKESEEVWRLP
jgi:HK97 family phage prohead protease